MASDMSAPGRTQPNGSVSGKTCPWGRNADLKRVMAQIMTGS